eukprot:gene23811-biopygen9646
MHWCVVPHHGKMHHSAYSPHHSAFSPHHSAFSPHHSAFSPHHSAPETHHLRTKLPWCGTMKYGAEMVRHDQCMMRSGCDTINA